MSSGRVVVSGAAGRIGELVVREVTRSGFDVVGLDRRRPSAELEASVERFVVGDAADMRVVAGALAGADAVVSHAAVVSPAGAEHTVFQNNILASYTTLDAAAEAGVRVAVVASSMAALGLSYAPERFSPKYVPVDEEHPCRPCDPYALSKVCDEAMGSMFARRAGMAVLAFRFPYTVAGEEIACRAAAMASDWAMGERELWAYLDVRDAARAVVLGLRAGLSGEVSGFEVLNILADDAMIDGPLSEAIREFHGGAELRGDGSITCGYSVAKAERLIGFRAECLRRTVAHTMPSSVSAKDWDSKGDSDKNE